MSYVDELWDRLLVHLSQHGTVDTSTPGRLRLGAEGTGRPVEVVITPDEWEDMVSIAWGDFDSAAEHLVGIIEAMPEGRPFLVYTQYAVEPSATPGPPPEPDDEPVADDGALPPGPGWFAQDGDGRWYRYPDVPDRS